LKWSIIGITIAIAVILAIALPLTLSSNKNEEIKPDLSHCTIYYENTDP
jgi:hypothetical protein